MERNLCVVIEAIIKAVPNTENRLILELKDIHESSRYSAPENQILFWNKAHEALCEYVFNESFNKDSWNEVVRKIFVGEIEV